MPTTHINKPTALSIISEAITIARIDAALAEPEAEDLSLMLQRQLDMALYRLAKHREALRAARHALNRAANNARWTERNIEPVLPHIDKVLEED